jgi:hypothetical protein
LPKLSILEFQMISIFVATDVYLHPKINITSAHVGMEINEWCIYLNQICFSCEGKQIHSVHVYHVYL